MVQRKRKWTVQENRSLRPRGWVGWCHSCVYFVYWIYPVNEKWRTEGDGRTTTLSEVVLPYVEETGEKAEVDHDGH